MMARDVSATPEVQSVAPLGMAPPGMAQRRARRERDLRSATVESVSQL